jgi:hypothetical protein
VILVSHVEYGEKIMSEEQGTDREVSAYLEVQKGREKLKERQERENFEEKILSEEEVHAIAAQVP